MDSEISEALGFADGGCRYRREGSGVEMRTLIIAAFLVIIPAALQAQTAETKQVQVFGQKIVYLEAGSGPPVILLHGLGANAKIWRATIPVLATKFHVYAPDQVGFGASDKPMIDYRPATLVDFLHEFMRKAGIGKATLVGNSLGGWVAALAAIAHPEDVDRLVLVDSAGFITQRPTRESIAFLNPSTLGQSREVMNRIFFNKFFINDATVADFFTAWLASGASYAVDRFLDSAVRGEDYLNESIGNIKSPTLVIWGREDTMLP